MKFFDYDNDGNLDLFLANGHPDDKVEEHSTNVNYKEPFLLLHNNGKTFDDVSGDAGPAFQRVFAARGMALGDFDTDGVVDVLGAVNNNAPVLLKNVAAGGNHWLGPRLVGKTCNPEAVGARITWQAGEFRRSRLKAA